MRPTSRNSRAKVGRSRVNCGSASATQSTRTTSSRICRMFTPDFRRPPTTTSSRSCRIAGWFNILNTD
jgi:hypothetical protein